MLYSSLLSVVVLLSLLCVVVHPISLTRTKVTGLLNPLRVRRLDCVWSVVCVQLTDPEQCVRLCTYERLFVCTCVGEK